MQRIVFWVLPLILSFIPAPIFYESVPLVQTEFAAVQSGGFVETFRLGRGGVRHIVWQSDGDLIALTEARLWRYRIAEHPVTLDWIDIPRGWWQVFAYSQSHIGIFMPGEDNKTTTLWLYDLDDFEFIKDVSIPQDVTIAAFVPNSSGIVFGTRWGSLRYLDWRTNSLTELDSGLNKPEISAIGVSADGRQAAISSEGHNQIEIWNLEERQLAYRLEIGDPQSQDTGFIEDVAFSPDGRFLTALTSTRQSGITHIHVFDLQTQQRVDLESMPSASQVVYNLSRG